MRGTRGIRTLVTALVLCACEPAVPPLPDVTPPPVSIPVTPVEPGVAFLRDAHKDMSESAFQAGGLQHWGWAVDSLRTARRNLDGDPRFAELLPALDALAQQAEHVLQEQDALQECRSFMTDARYGREADPARYDACWLRYEDSKTRRRALHDQLAELLRRAELAR